MCMLQQLPGSYKTRGLMCAQLKIREPLEPRV
jgi:hypothetical protein